MDEVTLLDELTCIIPEDDAEKIINILSALRGRIRIVSAGEYRVIEAEHTATPSTYTGILGVLGKYLQPTPPAGGRMLYVLLGHGYCVLAVVHGMKISVTIVLRGDGECYGES